MPVFDGTQFECRLLSIFIDFVIVLRFSSTGHDISRYFLASHWLFTVFFMFLSIRHDISTNLQQRHSVMFESISIITAMTCWTCSVPFVPPPPPRNQNTLNLLLACWNVCAVVQCVCGAVVFSGPMVHPWDDRQYILSNGGVASGKAKLKTRSDGRSAG
jgi:hypothetical protein